MNPNFEILLCRHSNLDSFLLNDMTRKETFKLGSSLRFILLEWHGIGTVLIPNYKIRNFHDQSENSRDCYFSDLMLFVWMSCFDWSNKFVKKSEFWIVETMRLIVKKKIKVLPSSNCLEKVGVRFKYYISGKQMKWNLSV